MPEIKEIALKKTGSSYNIFYYPEGWDYWDAKAMVEYIVKNEDTILEGRGVGASDIRFTADGGSNYYTLKWTGDTTFEIVP